MSVPRNLLDLELTLRSEQGGAQRCQLARLAGRLGFRTVWLPVFGDVPPAPLLPADLIGSARPAGLGLVLGGDPATLPQRVAAVCADPSTAGVWLEIDAPSGLREQLLAAVGVPRWRDRVVVPWADAQAAGLTVHGGRLPDRSAVLAALTGAIRMADRPDGRPVRRTAVLTASIGRTTAEAEARAAGDPSLTGGHPRESGIFGTLEQVQVQLGALAGAGADAVRVTITDGPDAGDVLAQLRAATVGPTVARPAQVG